MTAQSNSNKKIRIVRAKKYANKVGMTKKDIGMGLCIFTFTFISYSEYLNRFRVIIVEQSGLNNDTFGPAYFCI